MTLIKYLADCILAFIDFFNPGGGNSEPLIKALIGFICVAVIAAAYIVSYIFFNWYIALFITVGAIIAFCLLACIIETLIKIIAFIVTKIKERKTKQ